MEVDKPDRMELLSKLVALLEEHKKHKEYKEVKKRGRPSKQKPEAEEVIQKPVRKTKKDVEIDEEETLLTKLKDKLKGSKYLEPPKTTIDKKEKPKKSPENDEETSDKEDIKLLIREEIEAVKQPPPPPPKIEEKQNEIQQTINQVVEAIAPDMSKIKVAGIKSFLGSYKNKGL